MKGHAEKCVDMCCEWAKKDVSRLKQLETLCMDDHHMAQKTLTHKRRTRSRMSLPGSNRPTWYPVDSEHSGQVCHKNGTKHVAISWQD